MTSINVPSDGNCLLHSIALAFLDPTNHVKEFERRFQLIFGTGFEVECDNLFQQFSVNAIDANLYKQITNNQKWHTLIDKFRIILVRFMETNSHTFLNPVHDVWYIPNNSSFFNSASFNGYLESILKPGVWLGSLEILAASLLLDCRIDVQQQNKIIAKFNTGTNLILILEYLEHKKHYNFILKCSPLPQQKRKLPITESEFKKEFTHFDSPNELLQIKRLKLDNDSVKYDSSVSGLKRALHGTIYQLELLMLFLLRIEKLTEFFLLATEMDFAEKFDDVVLKYKMRGDNQYKWRFLQAKHKQDPTKQKITIRDLTSAKDDDFSLQKYFVSFYKIKTNKTNNCFEGAELEDFCILTNATFDLEIKENQRNNLRKSKEMWRDFFSEFHDLQDDPILFFEGVESEQVGFNQDLSTLENLSKLIKSALQLAINNSNKKETRIVKLLVDSSIVPVGVKDQIKSLNIEDFSDTTLMKILHIEEKINKLYKKMDKDQIFKLADDILELNSSTHLILVKEDLMKKSRLSEEKKREFLKQLDESIKEIVNKFVKIEDWLQTSGNTDSSIKVKDLKEALKNFDIYFPEFILKFRFVINYPSLDELSQLISSEIGADGNLLTPDLFAHSFEKVMLNWLQEKNSIFLSNQESYDIRDDIQVKLQSLMVAGLSKAYPEKLSSHNIKFQHRLPCLSTFLQATNVSILHLVSLETVLTSIKVLETLKELSDFTEFRWLNAEDSFIFIQLDSLVLPEIQKIALKSFSSNLRSQNLFIIECTANRSKDIGHTILYNNLSREIRRSPNKKVIVIGTEDDDFIKKFRNLEKVNINSEKFNDKTIFTDLDKNSQENMLSQQLVLQGEVVQLRDIVNGDMASELVDEAFLVALIKNDPIIIGDILKPHFNYNGQYYISRKLQHQKLKRSVLNSVLYLFVSNVTEEQLIQLKARKEKLCTFTNFNISKNIVFTESKDIAEAQYYFNKLCCKEAEKSFHWIIFNKGSLEWYLSKGEVTNILEHVDHDTKSVISKTSFEESDLTDYDTAQKTIIIADNPGMGKSTLLARVSLKIKENNPNWWVHVINLNDYSSQHHPYGLRHIIFDEDDLNAAIDFCSNLVLPSNFELVENKFIQNLFKTSLSNVQLFHKLNVVLLFDGFDEISPTYKWKAIKLIKCIQKTNVKQLWVTTRSHVKKFLESELNSPALLLNHFTNWDKVKFLNKFLKWHLKCREENLDEALSNLAVVKNVHINESNYYLQGFIQDVLVILKSLKTNHIKEYVSYLIENLDPSAHSWSLLLKWQKVVTTRKEDITSNPLHLKMLADVTYRRNVDLNENFSILTLYETFVNGSFDVFLKDKKTIGDVTSSRMVEISSVMNYKKIHQELALKFFMAHVNIKSIFSFLKNEIDNLNRFNYGLEESKIDIEELLVYIGLVFFNSGAELTFIHGSIAEYFLFEWVINHIEEEQVQEILVKVILIEGDYRLACEFFEIYLSKNTEQQHCIFSEKLVSVITDNDVETYSNNTILHLATIRDHSNIINFLTSRIQNYGNERLKKILLATNRTNSTALEVASLNKNIACFKILLNLYGLYCKEVLHFNLVSIFRNYFDILDKKQIENDNFIFKELISFAKQQLPPEGFKRLLLTPIKTFFSEKYKKVCTCNILHVMVYYRQKSNLEFLFGCLKDHPFILKILLLEKDIFADSLTPFYLALNKKYLEIIHLFVTLLQTNFRLLSLIILPLNNYRAVLGLLENPDVFEYFIEVIGQYLNPNDYRGIIHSLALSCNSQNETIFSISFNKNIGKIVLVGLLHKLDLQTICEDILLVSLYFKNSTPQYKYKFLEWFESCVTESVFKDNNAVFNTLKNVKEKIPLVLDETENLNQQIKLSTPDTSTVLKTNQLQLISKELLLSVKANLYTNILEFILQNSELEIQESVFNYLGNYPYILRALVLEADSLECTILHRLINNNKTEQIKVIFNNLKNFPTIIEDLILKRNSNEETAAHLAATNKNMEILEIILNNAIYSDTLVEILFAINTERRNTFEIAIERGAEDIVKLLLSFISLINPEYIDDLIFASYKHTENVVFLCFKTSCPSICNLLLDYIVERFEGSRVKKLFLDLNHLPTISPDDHGNLVFAVAQQEEFLMMDILWKYVNIIFENPSDCKEYMLSSNLRNLNFLHAASGMGSYLNIDFYLEELCKCVDLEALLSLLLDQNNSSVMTPLHYAVFHDKPAALKVLLSFCTDHLLTLYPNLLCKLLLTTEVSGCTLLTFAVEKNSLECFSLLLLMIKSLEQKHSGILRQILKTTNQKGKTVLHDIILENQREMLNELLEVLEMDSTLLDEVVLIEDGDGETILHGLLFEEDLDNIKLVMAKLKLDNTAVQIISKKNKFGLTPLHKIYSSCDPTEALTDQNVLFLRDQMKCRNLDEEIFVKLQKSSKLIKEFENAIKTENIEEVKNILDSCTDCANELFLMGAPYSPSFLYAAYLTNNIDIVKTLFQFLKHDSTLLRYVFLANEIQVPASFCDFEIISLVLEYAKSIQDEELYFQLLLESSVILVLKERKGNKKTRKLLKEETNKIVQLLLSTERKSQLQTIGFSYLLVLQNYVESNEYNGPFQEEYLEIIKKEIAHRNA